MRKKSYWNKLAVAAITTVVLLQGHLAPAEALASESQESKENLNTTEVKEETSEEEIVEIKEDSQEDPGQRIFINWTGMALPIPTLQQRR